MAQPTSGLGLGGPSLRALVWIQLCPVGLLLLPHAAAQPAGHAPVLSSSDYGPAYVAALAVDGDPATRWASGARGQPEWLLLDLGQPEDLDALTISWETAYALQYELQVSDDAETWTTVAGQADGRGGRETLTNLAARGRYVRIHCTQMTQYGIASIWEVEPAGPASEAAFDGLRRHMAEARERAAARVRALLADALEAIGCREIVYAVRLPGAADPGEGHWYSNFGYFCESPSLKTYRDGGGKLCALDPLSGTTRVIFEDSAGSVRDPQVDYDGQHILFSYLRAGTPYYHLYEISADGSGLRQITDGPYDDIEPTYLPDGGIVFSSSRSKRWVNCWVTQVATLHRCERDGSRLRPLSSNGEHDNTPWVLPDGRVLYMRWEYVDRSQVDYHHLWAMNPDGTEQTAFYGNMHPGTAMLDAKPIAGTRQVVSIFSPGHGMLEHQGPIALVDPGDGPDDLGCAHTIGARTSYRDPYALSPDLFLAADGPGIELVTADGASSPLYRLPDDLSNAGLWCHEPRPLAARPRERVIPPRVDLTQSTGRLILANVYEGRNMDGVAPGDIRRLLILESLPKPINYTGGMDPLSWGGTFTLERVLGAVPVEADGSANIEVPALRSLFFVALDDNGLSVKRMQSFVTVQPGETLSCVGCHEQRTRAVPPRRSLLALQREPSKLQPIAGVPGVFDFPRDIQPVLDRHCLACHDAVPHAADDGTPLGPRAGGVILSGDRGPMFSLSYANLTLRRQVADGRNEPVSNKPPRSIGTSASPLMYKLMGGHYGVQASPGDLDMVRYWIETGAPYPGTYGALGSGMIGGYARNGLVETDFDWPATRAASEAIQRRCVSCHEGASRLPTSLSDEMDISFWRPDWSDPRLRHSRHIVFDLTHPEHSLMLLAPLAAEAGGYGVCRPPEGGPAPFAGTSDPDYAAILAMCQAGKARLDAIRRFYMPGFRPPEPYLREMVRYGILPELPAPAEPVDSYALDQAYWGSLWFRPGSSE